MDADGSNPATVAECDPNLFCDVPSWGALHRGAAGGHDRPSEDSRQRSGGGLPGPPDPPAAKRDSARARRS
jgi:hypothetical protein